MNSITTLPSDFDANSDFSFSIDLSVEMGSATISPSQEGSTGLKRPTAGHRLTNRRSNKSGPELSWIFTYGYAVRGTGDARIYCNYDNGKCKATYSSPDGSTSNVIRHLKKAHGLMGAKQGKFQIIHVVKNFCEDTKLYFTMLAEDVWSRSGKPMSDPAVVFGPLDKHIRSSTSVTPNVKNIRSFHTKEEFRQVLVKVLVKNALPYNFLDRDELQELLYMARNTRTEADVALPSPNKMKGLINKTYEQARLEIEALLHDQERISFTVDVWTSGEGVSGFNDYLGIVGHFIDKDWKPRQVLGGFEVLESAHTGK